MLRPFFIDLYYDMNRGNLNRRLGYILAEMQTITWTVEKFEQTVSAKMNLFGQRGQCKEQNLAAFYVSTKVALQI